ncbi:hypothetical protein B566_EDAN015201 [Ephemera danica]|nr:hypothetical protein B566_EDAN015201 [Ephemera danica]
MAIIVRWRGDHTEAIDIDFNPNEITYDDLLSLFWKHHDPSSPSTKQRLLAICVIIFYSSFVYYHDEEQQSKATASLKEVEASKKKPVLTKIIPATIFYAAEDYHQKYRLQQWRELTSTLGLKTLDDLTSSHIAARLNGYLVGLGGVKQFDEEAETLGLTGDLAKQVRQCVIKNEGKGLFC